MCVCAAVMTTFISLSASELRPAFDSLVEGRSYLRDRLTLTQKGLINAFLSNPESANSNPNELRRALSQALAIRNDPGAAEDERRRAYIIINESLEALLFGYNAAGNKDLLDGTRISFPGSPGSDEARKAPVGLFESYQSESVTSLYYAHLYFLEGIKSAVDYLQRDSDGKLRATDLSENALPQVPFYTRWNNEENDLPWVDEDFRSDEINASLTAAALLGKSVRRYGATVTTLADRLWKAAFFHPNASGNREEVLDEAGEFLKANMHAQFLASLPIAAKLNDGVSPDTDAAGLPAPSRNEYQEVGADAVRVNVTAAQILAERIAKRERPKQPDLVPKWDRATVNTQLAKIASLRNTLATAWNEAEAAINQANESSVRDANDRLQRRDRYKFRLWQLTGIHPDSEPEFESLNTELGRTAYLRLIEDWIFEKTANFDPSDPWFTNPLTGFVDPATGDASPVSQVSDIGFASLRMVQALNEVKSIKSRIDSFSQRIQIEQWRTDTISDIVENEATVIGAMEAAEFVASSLGVTVCICGVSSGSFVKHDLGAALRGVNAPIKRLIQARNQTKISGANKDAAIQNLLIEQSLLAEGLPNVVIGAELAAGEVKRLFGEVERLVEDYAYHVDTTESFWYNDPEILFEQTAAEQRYKDLLQTYRVELYLLSKMLEKAWVEPYENPVLNAGGAYEQFAADPRFDLFPDSEAIFSSGNHNQASDFFDALKSWNNYLANGRRGGSTGGRSTLLADSITISVREHLLGLSDLKFDENRYVIDPVLRHENVRRFRAFVQRQRSQAQEEGFEMRLEFPFNLEQVVESEGLQDPVFLFSSLGVANPNIWNRRILGVGVELIGNNVTQGTFGSANQVPVSFYLHGNVTRESKFLDSLFTQQNRKVVTDLRLFQNDPYDLTVLGTDSLFSVEDLRATANNLQPNPLSPQQFPNIEWPLGCDNWVMLVRSGVANFNWENLDDIKLYVYWEAGPPVTLATNYAWPN